MQIFSRIHPPSWFARLEFPMCLKYRNLRSRITLHTTLKQKKTEDAKLFKNRFFVIDLKIRKM